MGSRVLRFSSCCVPAYKLWHTGLVAPLHVESSQMRDGTQVPYVDRWIPIHGTTNEVLIFFETCFYFFPDYLLAYMY